jgi:hypothetical protein
MSGEPIAATAWIEESTPVLEGDDVKVHAELTDVDEVTLIVLSGHSARPALQRKQRADA